MQNEMCRLFRLFIKLTTILLITLLSVFVWQGPGIWFGQESSKQSSTLKTLKYLGADISVLAEDRSGFGSFGRDVQNNQASSRKLFYGKAMPDFAF